MLSSLIMAGLECDLSLLARDMIGRTLDRLPGTYLGYFNKSLAGLCLSKVVGLVVVESEVRRRRLMMFYV